MEYLTLANGVQMPLLGYGVYQVDADDAERCVTDALEVGYRHIDTAQAYYNEEGVGRAIVKSDVAREDLFVTTKVWIYHAGEKNAAASIDGSLRKLGCDYADLLLIHQPFGDYYGTWRALEAAYRSGKARAIGVSNFYPDRLVDLCRFSDIKPMVNQVETHVFQQQRAAREVMDRYGVAHESWGPFAEGRNNFFSNPVLAAVGAKHGKTAAQTALRFLIQSGVAVIPKSAHKERMRENFEVFDFELDVEDMDALRALDTGESLFFSHYDPEFVEYMADFGQRVM